MLPAAKHKAGGAEGGLAPAHLHTVVIELVARGRFACGCSLFGIREGLL